MEPIAAQSLVAPPTGGAGADLAAGLRSDDFFRLLIAQLQQQDPLEPMDNGELLSQIASVREIELNTNLTRSLEALTGQGRFASAASLIGRYVTAAPDGAGQPVSGLVEAIRFRQDGAPVLQLANGSEVPIEQVTAVAPPLTAAEALIGRMVVGLDRRDPAEPKPVEGVVTAARLDDAGQAVLELDTGENLRLSDVIQSASTEPT